MPAGMPLPGSLLPTHLPLPSPVANIVSYQSAAPAPVGDWGICEDVFDEDGDNQIDEAGSETSSFGTSEGTLSGPDGECRDF